MFNFQVPIDYQNASQISKIIFFAVANLPVNWLKVI